MVRRRIEITGTDEPWDREQFERWSAMSKDERREFWSMLRPERASELKRTIAEFESRDPMFNAGLVRRAQSRMEFIDSVPCDVRRVINEYNLEIVRAFWEHGIRDGADIERLIKMARNAKDRLSPGLIKIFRYYGAKSDYSALYMITAARMEPAPLAPSQTRFRMNKGPNRRTNALE